VAFLCVVAGDAGVCDLSLGADDHEVGAVVAAVERPRIPEHSLVFFGHTNVETAV
jgi:hypothetical protein